MQLKVPGGRVDYILTRTLAFQKIPSNNELEPTKIFRILRSLDHKKLGLESLQEFVAGLE